MKCILKDIVDIISGGTPKTSVSDYWGGNIPWISIKDFNFGNVYINQTEKSITQMGLNNSSTNILKKNDIIISARGTVGCLAIINRKMAFNQSCYGIRVKNEIQINPKYLYWYLKNIMNELKTKTHGSVFDTIIKTDLENLKVNIPDIKVQNIVATIIDNITKKIMCNNEINNNLYELMKIKFNDYIDNMEEYEESVLSKIANYKNGLAMQKFRPVNEIGLPVIKIKEMNSGISSETERCKSDIDEEVIINNGDVLFAWSGTLCMNIWCEGKAGLNQHIFKVTSDKYPKWFYYFWTLKHLDNFIKIAAGKATTMGHIKRTELDKAVVKIPDNKSIDEMDKIFTPLLNKYINNNIENRNLVKLRDTLLPKLMNGEIDLDNIEI